MHLNNTCSSCQKIKNKNANPIFHLWNNCILHVSLSWFEVLKCFYYMFNRSLDSHFMVGFLNPCFAIEVYLEPYFLLTTWLCVFSHCLYFWFLRLLSFHFQSKSSSTFVPMLMLLFSSYWPTISSNDS